MTMMTMMTTIKTLLLSALLALSLNAAAAPLDDAKRAGHVIEVPTGYIKVTPEAPANINALVEDINKRRREAYERIGQRNGISADQVGAESYRKRVGG
jgi:uncharacterized protein YdbL (DUF1318 family)